MNKVRLAALLTGLGAGLVWNPSGLFAQQEPPESAVEAGRSVGSGRGTPVEELPQLFVTGERVTRSVKETPSSVYVVTDDDLRNLAGADRVDTILALTPNVQLINANNNGPTIRGQNSTGILSGVNSFLGGARPRTTTIPDEKTGVNRKEDSYLSARGKLLFEPTACGSSGARCRSRS